MTVYEGRGRLQGQLRATAQAQGLGADSVGCAEAGRVEEDQALHTGPRKSRLTPRSRRRGDRLVWMPCPSCPDAPTARHPTPVLGNKGPLRTRLIGGRIKYFGRINETAPQNRRGY